MTIGGSKTTKCSSMEIFLPTLLQTIWSDAVVVRKDGFNHRGPIPRYVVSDIIVNFGMHNSKDAVYEVSFREVNFYTFSSFWQKSFAVVFYLKEQLRLSRAFCNAEARRQNVAFRKVTVLNQPMIHVALAERTGKLLCNLTMLQNWVCHFVFICSRLPICGEF
jgi:hypothetical protein